MDKNYRIIVFLLLNFYLLLQSNDARRKNFNPNIKKDKDDESYDKQYTVGIILPEGDRFASSGRRLSPLELAIQKDLKYYNFVFSQFFNGTQLNYKFTPIADQLTTTKLFKTLCDEKSGFFHAKVNTLIFLERSRSKHSIIHQPYTQQLLNVAQYYGLPIITWDLKSVIQTNNERLLAHLTPSFSQQAQAILSLFKRYNWFSFAIVTGRLFGYEHFVTIIMDMIKTNENFHNMEIQISIHILDADNPKIVRQELEKLDSIKARIMILYSSRSEAEKIFEIANEFQLTRKNFVWIATKSVVSQPTESKTKELSMTPFPSGMFAISFDDKNSRQIFEIRRMLALWVRGMLGIAGGKKNSLDQKFQTSFNCNAIDATTTDLISKTPKFSGKLIFQEMLKKTWPYLPRTDQEFFQMNPIGISKPNDIYDIWNYDMNADGTVKVVDLKLLNLGERNFFGERQWKEMGEYSTGDGILKMSDISWPGGAASAPLGRPEKYHLKIVTLEEKPYVIYSDPDPITGKCPPMAELCRIASKNLTIGVANATTNSKLYQCCSGLCIDLLKMLSVKMQFNFELFQVRDEKWGAYDSIKKEWNGLIKDILDGEADMIMTSVKINPERSRAIDFSIPYLETGITIIVAVREGAISPTAFLEPYDYPSWLLILVFSVHASGAAIYIFEWLSPSGLDKGKKIIGGGGSGGAAANNDDNHRFSLFRSFWLMWAMLFAAAVNVDNPRGVSSRFMANIWALFALVFTASYTANLAAFMITKEDYDRLTGITDWRLMTPKLHKPPFKFATVPDGSTETILKKNYPHMYRYMKEFTKSKVEEGVKAVKEKSINAFIYDATVLEYLAGKDDGCKLRTVGNWYAMTGYGIGFPKGSKWKHLVNRYLLEFQHSSRELERLQRFWLTGACSSNQNEGGESSIALGIPNFTSAFILLCVGMLLGVFLLLLEHVYFKFFRNKIRRCDKCGCCGLVSLSLGRSLTFQDSVKEAIKLQLHYKCKNPLCQTNLTSIKSKLNSTLVKLDKLKQQFHIQENELSNHYNQSNDGLNQQTIKNVSNYRSKSLPTTPEFAKRKFINNENDQSKLLKPIKRKPQSNTHAIIHGLEFETVL